MQSNNQKQESISPQIQNNMWNPHIVLQTTKGTGPQQGTDPGVETIRSNEEAVQKFLDIGSRVVVTTATAWWTICELFDFIKLRSVEIKSNKENTDTEPSTPSHEVPRDESEF